MYVRMEVVGVRIEMPSNQPIVLLKEVEGSRFLPIWVGAHEATAIAFAQQGMSPKRPLTHDLMADVLGALAFAIGMAIGGYQTVAVMGFALTLGGAVRTIASRTSVRSEARVAGTENVGPSGFGAKARSSSARVVWAVASRTTSPAPASAASSRAAAARAPRTRGCSRGTSSW